MDTCEFNPFQSISIKFTDVGDIFHELLCSTKLSGTIIG